jgi:hypothetical protein
MKRNWWRKLTEAARQRRVSVAHPLHCQRAGNVAVIRLSSIMEDPIFSLLLRNPSQLQRSMPPRNDCVWRGPRPRHALGNALQLKLLAAAEGVPLHCHCRGEACGGPCRLLCPTLTPRTSPPWVSREAADLPVTRPPGQSHHGVPADSALRRAPARRFSGVELPTGHAPAVAAPWPGRTRGRPRQRT